MKRAISVLVIGLMLAIGSTTALAATVPLPVTAAASGIELCPQFICGIAIFTGIVQGQIGNNPNAFGTVTVALNHTDLPTAANPTPAQITKGIWQLQKYSGTVIGGLITLKEDKLFRVQILMKATDGRTLYFDGTLDHHPLIPTVKGAFVPISLP